MLRSHRAWMAFLIVLACTASASSAPPWAKLVPFKKVDSDPSADYSLTESHGPWMIMVASFTAPPQACAPESRC